MKRSVFFNIFLFFLLVISAGYAEQFRDPFVSLGDKMGLTPQGKEEKIRLPYPVILKGTLCLKDTFVAIVNDDIIKPGQKWREFYVEKVGKNMVILEWKGKRFQVILNPEKKKSHQKK